MPAHVAYDRGLPPPLRLDRREEARQIQRIQIVTLPQTAVSVLEQDDRAWCAEQGARPQGRRAFGDLTAARLPPIGPGAVRRRPPRAYGAARSLAGQ
eukprot:scaffold58606_cov64-Phaeocystis_antarctica.AAC.5